ncbi:MAG TPA: hypothetical protein PKA05_23250 [Roseiflexaceae bacterium]|nr:hypothetical protein [Roseiflexaceae bacterium]HMP43310.1 hypothetical protein [Roseiflexaceae bacterium]
MSEHPAAPPPADDEPERRVRRGCIGMIVICLSALFVVAGQTGMSWATILLLVILVGAIGGLILVRSGQKPTGS